MKCSKMSDGDLKATELAAELFARRSLGLSVSSSLAPLIGCLVNSGEHGKAILATSQRL